MATLHFLNVGPGDCTWISHDDGKNTVIDICNGRGAFARSRTMMENLFGGLATRQPLPGFLGALSTPDQSLQGLLGALGSPPQGLPGTIGALNAARGVQGNFGQKDYPVNPIQYLRNFGVNDVFRFILTHPDMDHMDGLEPFFEAFSPTNFWDTNNNKQIDDFTRYEAADWHLYQRLKQGNPIQRLSLHSGDRGKYWNQNEDGSSGGSGIHILSPTPQIVAGANQSGDFNDCSYVLLFWAANGKRVIIGGDSHDVSWEHILKSHRALVQNVDLLIAPHHGRDSDRSYDFLDVLKPKLTLFGSARSEHLGYHAWSDRGLEVMTNNQGNCFIANFSTDIAGKPIIVMYCTNRTFADAYCSDQFNGRSHENLQVRGWYLKCI